MNLLVTVERTEEAKHCVPVGGAAEVRMRVAVGGAANVTSCTGGLGSGLEFHTRVCF